MAVVAVVAPRWSPRVSPAWAGWFMAATIGGIVVGEVMMERDEEDFLAAARHGGPRCEDRWWPNGADQVIYDPRSGRVMTTD